MQTSAGRAPLLRENGVASKNEDTCNVVFVFHRADGETFGDMTSFVAVLCRVIRPDGVEAEEFLKANLQS